MVIINHKNFVQNAARNETKRGGFTVINFKMRIGSCNKEVYAINQITRISVSTNS